MRFGLGKTPSFTRPGGRDLPSAHRAAARRRYAAMLREARDILPCIPPPGESLHALMTGLYAFMSVVALVITTHPTPCEMMRVATLAFSARNVQEIVQLASKGALHGVCLLCGFLRQAQSQGVRGSAGRPEGHQRPAGGATLPRHGL